MENVMRDEHELFFIMNKSCMSKSEVLSWIRTPEFFDIVYDLKTIGVEINDETLLPIMVSIYDEKDLLRKQKQRVDGFDFQTKRHSIKRIMKSITEKKEVSIA